jgi:hypothetical protein
MIAGMMRREFITLSGGAAAASEIQTPRRVFGRSAVLGAATLRVSKLGQRSSPRPMGRDWCTSVRRR